MNLLLYSKKDNVPLHAISTEKREQMMMMKGRTMFDVSLLSYNYFQQKHIIVHCFSCRFGVFIINY